MAQSQTVDELLQQVREQLDEFNTDTVDDAQILNALNRGHRKASNVTSRRLDEALLTTTDTTTNSTDLDTYDMPKDIFARKIQSMQVVNGEFVWKIEKIDQAHAEPYLSNARVQRPYYYYVVGSQIRLVPTPKDGLTIRWWYLKKPDRLVESQGRITTIGSTSVIVDSAGSDLSSENTSLNNYVSFIDFVTGKVKGSAQITGTVTNETINFKATPDRTSVLNKTVSGTLPTDLAVDDHVCVVSGTCISQLPESYVDFVIQFAVLELKRRFGEPTQEEILALNEQEKELKKSWAGRERKTRIRKSSSKWGPNVAGTIRRFLG